MIWLLGLVALVALGGPVAGADGEWRLEALDWLAGCWEGEGGEECWMAAAGGMMLGLNRPPAGGGVHFELLRIVEEEGDLVYLASPGGRCPPTRFTAIELADRRVVFANPEHDFPQRITYWLDEGDLLHARVEAGDEGFELVWRRRGWSD